jgi:hypothetical protein
LHVDDLRFDGSDFVFSSLEFNVVLVRVVLFQNLNLFFVHADLTVSVLQLLLEGYDFVLVC